MSDVLMCGDGGGRWADAATSSCAGMEGGGGRTQRRPHAQGWRGEVGGRTDVLMRGDGGGMWADAATSCCAGMEEEVGGRSNVLMRRDRRGKLSDAATS